MADVENMTADQAYADRFDNMPGVAHPSLMFGDNLKRFEALLQMAVNRGAALTRDEVEKEFGGQPWDW
jgi:hypothetical protein